MSAIQAFQVVEIGLVELGAQGCTGLTASHSSSQAAKHRTGDAADGRARRAKRQANGRTNSGSTGGHGDATGSACNRAIRATDLAAILQGDNADGPAGRTLNDHETSMKWGQEGHSFLASWR